MSNIAQLLASRKAAALAKPEPKESARKGRKELDWESIELSDYPQEFQDQITLALAAKAVANAERMKAGQILAEILEPGPDLIFRVGFGFGGKVSVALDRREAADTKPGLTLADLVAKVNALSK